MKSLLGSKNRVWRTASLFVLLAFLLTTVLILPSVALNPQPEPPIFAVNVAPPNAAVIKNITKNVHQNYRIQVINKKKSPTTVLAQQLQYIKKQPSVQTASLQPGGNILVKYKNGYQMLMLLGKKTFGTSLPVSNVSKLEVNKANPAITQVENMASQGTVLKPSTNVVINPDLVKPNPALFLPPTPTSRKALIFNTMADQTGDVATMGNNIRNYLAEIGYQTTLLTNNQCGLAAASNMDNDYGFIFFIAHGGVVNNDFHFMVRPYYTSPPPLNSGYTGTVVFSVDNWVTDQVNYVYAIGSQFAGAYWTNTFPKTIWADCSCSSSAASGMNGLPKWVVDHGSAAWTGWDATLSYSAGTFGSPYFVNKLRYWRTLGEASADVKAAGYYPPNLTIYPTNRASTRLPIWKLDYNEAAIPDSLDFSQAKLDRTNNLTVQLKFFAPSTSPEFFMYADTGGGSGPEVVVKCHPGDFKVHKLNTNGTVGPLVFSGTPSVSGANYTMTIPYATTMGTSVRPNIWFQEPTSGDRMPDPLIP